MNTYISGTLVQSTATFTNQAGTPTDPTTITLKYKVGGAAAVTVVYPNSPIQRTSAGIYYALLDTTGWTGPGNRLDIQEWIGTGSVQGIQDDSWEVEPPAI